MHLYDILYYAQLLLINSPSNNNTQNDKLNILMQMGNANSLNTFDTDVISSAYILSTDTRHCVIITECSCPIAIKLKEGARSKNQKKA